MTFDHVLPSAAIPVGAVVDGRELSGTRPERVTVLGIRNATPRPGLITWQTDYGDVIVHANVRFPVNLPEPGVAT